MDGPGSRLAARFRKAVADRDSAKQQAEEQARRAAEAARLARRTLLEDLAALATEIGVVRAVRDGEGLTLRFGDRYLHFEPEGDLDRVKIEIEGAGDEENVLYRQAELQDRWVWARRRRSREDRVPLFDAGLEELLVRGLGLPRPGEGPPEAPGGPKRL